MHANISHKFCPWIWLLKPWRGRFQRLPSSLALSSSQGWNQICRWRETGGHSWHCPERVHLQQISMVITALYHRRAACLRACVCVREAKGKDPVSSQHARLKTWGAEWGTTTPLECGFESGGSGFDSNRFYKLYACNPVKFIRRTKKDSRLKNK